MRRVLVTAGLAVWMMLGSSAQDALVGNWQGTLAVGPNMLRIGLIVASEAGQYRATLVVIDQEGAKIPVQRMTLTGNSVHLDVPAINGTYDGTLSSDRQAISGAFSQGMPQPINFNRVEILDAPPTFGEPEKAAVIATVNKYFQSFSVKDFDAFRTCFHPPYIMWNVGSAPATFATLDDIVTRYQGVRAPL